MHTLLFTLIGIACGLRATQAISCYHECQPMTLQNALCTAYTTMYLIQAEVVEETGPLLAKWHHQFLDTMTGEEKESYFEDYGFMRYTLAVKEIYRDDNLPIQPTSVVQTWLGSDKCGMRLTVGKTYVLGGGWHIDDNDELAMNTDSCDYIRQYDSGVDVKMPRCDYNLPLLL